MFEHRNVKDDFINPCCFGEDLAGWLQTRLGATEFVLEGPVMEDYGWGFWAKHAKGRVFVSLSYAQAGPVEEPAEWVVGVEWQNQWFRQPDESAFFAFTEAIWNAFKAEPRIRFVKHTEP